MLMLFAGPSYYPEGGFNDFVGAFSSLESCQMALPASSDWAHVLDVDSLTIVAHYLTPYGLLRGTSAKERKRRQELNKQRGWIVRETRNA